MRSEGVGDLRSEEVGGGKRLKVGGWRLEVGVWSLEVGGGSAKRYKQLFVCRYSWCGVDVDVDVERGGDGDWWYR